MANVPIGSISPGDSRLLVNEETTFLFLRGQSGRFRLLSGYEEVFGRNQVRLALLEIVPTDLLGLRCLHCSQALEDPQEAVIVLHGGQVTDCLHEGCFRKWFVHGDKTTFSPYRFVTHRTCRVVPETKVSRLVINGRVQNGTVELVLLEDLDFAEIVRSDERSETANERQTIETGGKAGGKNLFLCPRCTKPQEIPFLETEEKIHRCRGCGGYFQIVVREVKR